MIYLGYAKECLENKNYFNAIKVFEDLKTRTDLDTILITGDLTDAGDLDSHREFAAILRDVQQSGKRVFVVTAGHDFNDHPFAFNENGRVEPEGTGFSELLGYYGDFGYKNALAFKLC